MDQDMKRLHLGTKFFLEGIDRLNVGEIQAKAPAAERFKFFRASFILMKGEIDGGA